MTHIRTKPVDADSSAGTDTVDAGFFVPSARGAGGRHFSSTCLAPAAIRDARLGGRELNANRHTPHSSGLCQAASLTLIAALASVAAYGRKPFVPAPAKARRELPRAVRTVTHSRKSYGDADIPLAFCLAGAIPASGTSMETPCQLGVLMVSRVGSEVPTRVVWQQQPRHRDSSRQDTCVGRLVRLSLGAGL